nr:hypothetical protein GCM10020093_062460 [Planobispora longispora]
MTVIRPHAKPALALACALSLAGCSGSEAATQEYPTWHDTGLNTVSRTVVAGGVVMATTMKPDGTLENVALDLASGKRLWSSPTTMAGRLPGMGVPPPRSSRPARAMPWR